jgi:glycosyltransferase involved in cell wall biosynthesis
MTQNKSTILLSHPTGNTFVKGLLMGLHSNNLLHSFHTSVACFEGDFLDKLAILPPFKDFRRRMFSTEIRDKTVTYPYNELGRMFAQKFQINSWLTHEQGRFYIDRVCRKFDWKIAKYIARCQDITAVYAYEDCAVESFKIAKSTGKICFYDLPIGYWRAMHRMLSEEKERNSDWAVTLGGFNDSMEKLQRKDKELALADVIYVASSFTKRTLEEYPGKLAPVQVIPYAFPVVNHDRRYTSAQNRKIKLLYVGGLSQRKGIAYMFEAVKGLEQWVKLTVVGQGNLSGCETLRKELTKHKYIPSLPHHEILQLMSEHDVLLFPSLFEGFGLVITEAMSQGTPVITTDRTCAPDIITHGQDSWLIESGSVSALRQQIESILLHPESLKTVGQAAIQTAQKRPWSKYGQEMADSIQQFLNTKRNA